MDRKNQQDAKQFYIQTYIDALEVLVRRTKPKNERLPVEDMINHALKLAQYKTYINTGVNITRIDFGANTEKMHELAGESRVGRRFQKQISQMMRSTRFGYGSSSGEMTAKTIGREVRPYFLMAQEAKGDLLKKLGLEKDAILTGASPQITGNPLDMKGERVKVGSPEASPEAMAVRREMREAYDRSVKLENARLHQVNIMAGRPNEGYVPNPDGIAKIDTRELGVERKPIGDLFHQNVDPTGAYNPQQEHAYVDDILKRYNNDPYAPSGDSLKLSGTNVPVKDAFGNEIKLRVIPESDRSELFPTLDSHDIEKGFFDKVLKEDSEYLRDDIFHGLFKPSTPAPADRMRADIQTAKDIATRHLSRVKQDAKDLRSVNEMLQSARKTKQPLEVIMQQPKFKDSAVTGFVTNRLPEAAMGNDKAVMMEIAQFMRRELFVPQSVLDNETLTIGKMNNAVSRSLRDLYNKEDRNFYDRTNVYRRFMKDYSGMVEDLKEWKGIVGSEYQAYADFGIDRVSEGGLMSSEEMTNLHRETTKHIEGMEFDDKVKGDINLDARKEAGVTNNQRVRNMILEQMEENNSTKGTRMRQSLITTIEGNIDALTTFAVSDSEADMKAADKKFAERLMARLQIDKGSSWRGLTPEGMEAIIEGFGIDRTNLKATRASIDEAERQARKPLTTVLEAKRQLQSNRMSMWRDAAYRQQVGELSGNEHFLRVPGRQGRFQIATNDEGKLVMDNEKVMLKAEYILPTDISVSVPVDHDRIHTIMDEMDTLKYNQELGRQYNYERAQQTIRESHVTLRYQHQAVNEDMKEQFQTFYEKLVRLEENIHVGMTPEQIYAAREVNVPLANLLEPYNKFMSRAGEDSSARLPNFMKSMINNQLPYMRKPGQESELASMAYMAIVDAVESLPSERVVDLSDEGMTRMFLSKNPRATDEEKAAFMSSLKGQGLSDRWQEFIEDRAKRKMYDQFYNTFDGTERRSAGASVVNEVVQHLKAEYGKTGSSEFDVTPSNVRSYVQRISGDLRELPFYREAVGFSEAEIAEIIKEGELGNRFTSFEDYFSKMAEDMNKEDTHGFKMQAIDDEVLNVADNPAEFMKRFIDKDLETDAGEFYRQNGKAITQEMENVPLRSHNQLTFMYDLHKTNNPNAEFMDAMVNFQGEQYAARIKQASGGEYFAYIPSLNQPIFIPRHESEAVRSYGMHEFEPQMSFAGRTTEQLTASGGVRRSHVGDYATIQRNVQADPSDTFDLMRQMMTGKKNGVYFDMETTGLSGSTLNPKLIQPLEMYMQEAQWNPRANNFYRIKDEVGVRQNGRTRKVAEHIFIQPSEEVISFANKGIAALDKGIAPWTFGVGNKQMSLADVLRSKAADDGSYMNLRKQILSQEGGENLMKRVQGMEDRLWFMRNIAKYSGNQENFQGHIGYLDEMMDDSMFSKYLTALKVDTEKALQNFEINPKTGKLNLFTEMPEFRKAKVMTPDQAVEAYANFTRNRVVMGQNVAEADVKKIVGMADNFVESATAELMMQKEGIIDTLTRDFNQMIDPIHDSYVTMTHPEDPTRRFSLIPGEEVDSILNAKSNMITPDSIMSLGEALEDDRSLMARAMANVAEQNHGGDMSALRQYMEDQAGGLDSVYVLPQDVTSVERRMQQEALINQFRNAEGDDLARLMQEHGVGNLDRYHTARGLRAEVASPEVMEQMFAASLALPGLRRRNAETIQSALNINIDTAQHTAAADVGRGLAVFRELFRQADLGEDPGMLTAGDLVMNHATVDPDIPLGTYEIQNVGKENLAMRAIRFDENGEMIRGNTFTVGAANEIDLNRKFQLNFDYLETPGAAREAYTEFAEDQARRQISRATQSLFNFDRTEMEYGLRDVDPTAPLNRSPLQMMEAYRTNMNPADPMGAINSLPMIPEGSREELAPLLNRVAFDSERTFNREDFRDLASWDVTTAKRAAFDVGGGFYGSEEGLARRNFLAEVDAMQTFGVVDKKVGRDLIRSMNASIMERGKEMGATRVPMGMVHAGTMTDVFGSMSGENMALNVSTTRKLQQGLYSYAERIMKEQGQGEAIGGAFMLENERKREALNNVLFPYLKDRGIVDYDTSINMDEAVRQIMSRNIVAPGAEVQRGDLQQFEEYDFLGFRNRTAEQNTEFAQMIQDRHNELLQPYRDGLGETHMNLINQRNAEIDTLRQNNLYDPNLTIRPELNLSDADLSTINLTNFGGPKQWDTAFMEKALERTQGSGIVGDVELRRNIMNELFDRATAGRPNSIEGLIGENLGDPGRMEAARILGWVEGDASSGYRPSENIGDMYFGRSYYTGRHNPAERFSDVRIKELPVPVIESILGERYTEDSGNSFMQGLINQYTQSPSADGSWVENDWRSQHVGPAQIPIESVKRSREVTADDLIAAGVPENQVPSHLDDMVRIRKEMGEAAAQKRGVLTQTDMDMSKRVREPGAIGNAIRETREAVGSFVSEGGAGHTAARAGMWVAGIGIAAYALKQFATAGGPLKFEHRPQGHGVEGIGGGGDNDDMQQRELQAGNSPSARGKAYVGAEGGKGFSIRARARNNGAIDHQEITNELQSDIGSFNVNLSDDRESMNREWLQGQMDQYMTRGHLG